MLKLLLLLPLLLLNLSTPTLSQSSNTQCTNQLTLIFQQALSIFVGGQNQTPTPSTPVTQRQKALHYILDSGLSLNDLGNYQDCVDELDSINSKYFIIMLQRKASTIIHNKDNQFKAVQAPRNLKIGICVPGQCSELQIKNQLNGFIQSYLIPNYVITSVVDTSKKPDYLDNNSTNAYKLTIIIVSVLLILMGILGIFIQKTTLGDTQNQEEFMSSRGNKYDDQDKGASDQSLRLKNGRNSSLNNPFQSDDLDRDDARPSLKFQQRHSQQQSVRSNVVASRQGINSSYQERQSDNPNAPDSNQSNPSRQKTARESTIHGRPQNKQNKRAQHTQRKSILEIARKKALMGKILLCFSLLNNFLNIIRKSGRNRYHIFDGARVYLIAWIIVADTIFYTFRYGTLVNFDSIQALFLHDFIFSLLATLPFIASGAYFFTSGFLSLNWLLHMQTVKYDRTHYCLLLGRYYVHRLIRLWPAYIYVIFATIYMSNIFVSGPLQQDYEQANYHDKHLCHYYWNILFLNSIIESNSCLSPWTAFFSTDIILVFLLPLFVYLVQLKRRYVRQYKYAYILVVLLIIIGLVVSIGVNQNNPIFMVVNSSYLWIMSKVLYPLNFIAPFSAGMLCALFMRDGQFDEEKEAFRRSKLIRYLLYLAAVFLFALIAVFNWWITRQHATGGKYNNGYSNPYTNWNYLIPIAIFLHSMAFGVIIMSMLLGRANFVSWFLKSRLFTIGARLFMLSFICHPSIILVFVVSAEDSTYLRISQILYYSLANLAISNTVAFIICLLVEMPSRNIRKLFIKFNIKGGKNRNPFPLLDKELKLLSKGSYASYN